MSVHNGARYMGQAIESVLAQTFADFEFIIVEDGSTDNTLDVIADYAARDQRIRIIANGQNLGLTKSLNVALEQARGEFIARQDADDTASPNRFEEQVKYLREHPEIGLLGTAYHVIDSEGRARTTHPTPLTDSDIRWMAFFYNPFCHTSVMFSHNAIERHHLQYDEALTYSQDFDLWSRMLEHAKAANLDAPLVCFRAHDASLSATRQQEQQAIAAAIVCRQIKQALPDVELSVDDARKLREFYYRLPRNMAERELTLCHIVFRLVDYLSAGRRMDERQTRNLKQEWMVRILNVSGGRRLRRLLASPLREDFLNFFRRKPVFTALLYLANTLLPLPVRTFLGKVHWKLTHAFRKPD